MTRRSTQVCLCVCVYMCVYVCVCVLLFAFFLVCVTPAADRVLDIKIIITSLRDAQRASRSRRSGAAEPRSTWKQQHGKHTFCRVVVLQNKVAIFHFSPTSSTRMMTGGTCSVLNYHRDASCEQNAEYCSLSHKKNLKKKHTISSEPVKAHKLPDWSLLHDTLPVTSYPRTAPWRTFPSARTVRLSDSSNAWTHRVMPPMRWNNHL